MTLGRALRAGMLLGTLAGLLLGAVEVSYTLVTAPFAFDHAEEAVRFVLVAGGLCGAVGALAGALEGLVVHLAGRLVGRLGPARRRSAEAALYTALAAPAVALGTFEVFSGRRARAIPGWPLVVALVAGALLAVLFVLLRRIARQARRWSEAPAEVPRGRRLTAPVGALLLAALVLVIADRRVLPRLYLPLHLALELGAFAAAELGLGLLALGLTGPVRRRLAWFATPRGAVVLALLAAIAGRWSVRNFAWWPTLRAAAFQHTGAPAHLLWVAQAMKLGPAPRRTWALPEALSGAETGEAREVEPLPDGPHRPGADIFLITVDAMRADRLAPRTTPHLTELAARSVVFERAYTQVPHTSFALATLLTGKYVYSLAAIGEDPARHETLAEVFQRDHYKTAAFFPPSVFFIDHERFAQVETEAYRFEYVKYEHMGARGRTDQVIDFLEKERPARVLAWVHYFEPHEPYDLHPGVTVDGRAPVTALERYDGEVRYVDGEIHRLLEYLGRTRPGAIIAFTADHGEEFGEHGGRYHGTTLYEEQVHVPLLIHVPGLAPRRVARPVGLVDLAPTLLGLADILPSAQMRGTDLGPWITTAAAPGQAAPEERLGPVFAEIGSKKLVASGSERLICDVALDFCELYDLRADGAERHNLASAAPERVEALRRPLEAWMTSQSAREAGVRPGREAEVRRALERGRQGDRSVAGTLSHLLDASDAAVRDEAALVLLRLPPDPATHDAIMAAHARSSGNLLTELRRAILAYRLGERQFGDELAKARQSGDPELVAHAALALADAGDRRAVPLAVGALPVLQDEALEKRLIAALGALHDVRATQPLLDHMEDVRTRADTVRALGELGDGRVVQPLARAITSEPYVPVRMEMARVLGRMRDRAAIPALVALWKKETEAQVVAEVAAALVELGAVGRVRGVELRAWAARGEKAGEAAGWSCDRSGCAPRGAVRLPRPDGSVRELWLVTDGTAGDLEVGGMTLRLRPEVRAYLVAPAAAAMRVKVTGGSPRLTAVLPR